MTNELNNDQLPNLPTSNLDHVNSDASNFSSSTVYDDLDWKQVEEIDDYLNHSTTPFSSSYADLYQVNIIGNRPYLDMELIVLPDEPLKVLLDTGASFNVFNTTMYDMVRHLIPEDLEHSSIQLRSHTNTLIQVRGRVMIHMKLLSPGLSAKLFKIPFLVTEDHSNPKQGRIILGGSFMKEEKLGLIMGFGPEDQSFLSVPRKDYLLEEMEESNPKLLLLEDLTFGPGEIKQTLASINLDPKYQGRDVLCHIEVPHMAESIDALVKVSHKNTTNILLENRTTSSIILTEGTVIGELAEEIESIIPALPVFTAMKYLGSEGPVRVNHCFCESSAIIGLLHNNGFTAFPEEHLFSVNGELVNSGFLTLDIPQKRLFIDGNKQKVRNVDYTRVLDQIASTEKLEIAVPKKLDLTTTYILNRIVEWGLSQGKNVVLVSFNTERCLKHGKRKIIQAPMVWVHVQFTSAIENSQTRREITTPKFSKDKIIQKQSIHIWGNNIELILLCEGQILLVDCKLNDIKQMFPKYIEKFTTTVIRFLNRQHLFRPDLTLSCPNHPSYNQVQMILNSQKGLMRKEQLGTLLGMVDMRPKISQGINFSYPEVESNHIEEVQELNISNYEDGDIGLLNFLDELFKDTEIPYKDEIDRFPALQTKAEFKKWENTTSKSQFENELLKYDEELREFQTEKQKMKPEDFDNHSEVSNMTNKTNLPTFLPNVITEFADPKTRVTDWRQIFEFHDGFEDWEIKEYSRIFDENIEAIQLNLSDHSFIKGYSMNIETEGTPIYQRPYPISAKLLEGVRSLLDEAIKKGLIRKCTNEQLEWLSPSFVVVKNSEMKADKNNPKWAAIPFGKKYRLVINYTLLNSKTKVPGQTDMPLISTMLADLQGYKIFTAMDLSQYYHSIPLEAEAQLKAAFSVGPDTYVPLVLYEGISKAVSVSMKISREIAGDPCKPENKGTQFWIDDFILAAVERSEMIPKLEAFLRRCVKIGVKISLAKSQFNVTTVKFLGFNLRADENGIVHYIPITQRFNIFENMPMPKDTQELYRFIGLSNFIQEFVLKFHFLMSPFYSILAERVKSKTVVPIEYSEEEQKAFKLITMRMASIKEFVIPSQKFPILIDCDSNFFGCSAVMLSKINEKWEISSFYSKRFPAATIRCNSSLEKELLGLLLTLDRYKTIIMGMDEVIIRLDCRSLICLIMKAAAAHEYSKASRWLARLYMHDQLKFVHHANRERLAHVDVLADRFAPEDLETHEHLLQQSFKTMKRDQVKVPLIEAKDTETVYSLGELADLVLKNKEALAPLTPTLINETQSETEDSPHPCNVCDKVTLIPAALEEIAPDKFIGVQKLRKYTVSYLWRQQQKDPETNKIIERVRLSDPHPSLKLYNLWNGVLLIRKSKKDKNKGMRIVLPTGTVTRLICEIHGTTHSSPEILKNMVKRFYYHPKIGHISKVIAQGCQVCGICKTYTHKILPLGTLSLTTRPGQILYLDFMSMKRVQGANQVAKYLLVIVDAFSSYIMAFPTLDMEAGTVIKILRHVVNTVPNIQTVVSDNQTSLLINKDVASFLENQQIMVRTVIAYSSKSNLCENANKQVRSILRVYQETTGLNWLKCLDPAMKALNSISHTHGKMGSISPFELFFRVAPDFQDPLKANSISEEMLAFKIQALKEIRELRYNNIEKMMKERMEKSQIKEGSLVRLLNINRTDKQTPNYLPNKFRITKLRNHLVILEDVDDVRITHRVHIDRIKPIHQLTESVINHLRPKNMETLGQDPNLAKATSSITDYHSEQDTMDDESESDEDLVSDGDSRTKVIEYPITKTKSKILSVVSSTKLKDPLKNVPITPKITPVIGPKTIPVNIPVPAIPVVTTAEPSPRSDPKDKPVKTPKKTPKKAPSIVSVSPSDSVSQVGRAKSFFNKTFKDMKDALMKLSPPKKSKLIVQLSTGNPSPKTPIKQKVKYESESDTSPEKFTTPDSSPEPLLTSTAAQGAVPKRSLGAILKPAKFMVPPKDPITVIKKEPKPRMALLATSSAKRKALSPGKDDLIAPEAKVVVRSQSDLPAMALDDRPKRSIKRIDYKLLHTKGIRREKSPEY